MKSTLLTLALASFVTAASLPVTSDATDTAAAAVVHYVGRVNPATKELTWPSTGVAFNFTGTSATIDIVNIIGANSVDLYVDGGAPIAILNVTGPIKVPTQAYGVHSVVVRKRSETALGTMVVGDVTTDGKITKHKLPKHQIEIIGDSISVGYGMDGTFPCVNTAAVEDSPNTYGALTANALGADYSIVAWSGKGIIRNYVSTTVDTSPIMPELWTRYGANDADNSYTFPSSWNPKAIVINLGTNDFSYMAYYANGTEFDARPPLNGTTYQAAMTNFILNVTSHYPKSHYFLMSSPLLGTWPNNEHTTMSDALKGIVAQLGPRYQFVNWPTQGSTFGCDYHPNAATNAAEAQVLTAAISATLGWTNSIS